MCDDLFSLLFQVWDLCFNTAVYDCQSTFSAPAKFDFAQHCHIDHQPNKRDTFQCMAGGNDDFALCVQTRCGKILLKKKIEAVLY